MIFDEITNVYSVFIHCTYTVALGIYRSMPIYFWNAINLLHRNTNNISQTIGHA